MSETTEPDEVLAALARVVAEIDEELARQRWAHGRTPAEQRVQIGATIGGLEYARRAILRESGAR